MDKARELMAFSVVALFALALWYNPTDQMMLGALIGSFTTAIGYYLGSSKRDDKTVPVTVENDTANPVPVEGQK